MKKIACLLYAFLFMVGAMGCRANAQDGFSSSQNQSSSQNSVEEMPLPVPEKKSKAAYIHISFDDVQTCFANLNGEVYESVWQEPFFGWLKSLHIAYGARFSLYTYTSVLRGVSDKYANEFSAASTWLKFGFHADTSGHNLSGISYETGKSYWNEFVGEVIRVTGGTDTLDRLPRLEYFSGSNAGLLGMRDATCGAVGFLSADDSRNSYYFDEQTTEYLYTNDELKDQTNGLLFLSTDVRGDWFADNFSTANAYRKPLKATVYEELAYRERTSAFDGAWQSVIFFTHEWQVYSAKTLNSKKAWVEQACEYAKDYELPFIYPQERVLA
jgi:hypothetical protein